MDAVENFQLITFSAVVDKCFPAAFKVTQKGQVVDLRIPN